MEETQGTEGQKRAKLERRENFLCEPHVVNWLRRLFVESCLVHRRQPINMCFTRGDSRRYRMQGVVAARFSVFWRCIVLHSNSVLHSVSGLGFQTQLKLLQVDVNDRGLLL